jgi:hypothetical protein
MTISIPSFLCRYVMILFITSVFVSASSNAQSGLPSQGVELYGGYADHGTGDMKGIVYGVSYRNYLSRRLSVAADLRSTINNSIEPIFYAGPAGRITDGSIRFTTAGVQVGVNAGFSIIRSREHEFMVSLGGFGRYQSSNYPDIYSISYNQSNPLQGPTVSFDNRSPQKTFTAGYLVQTRYNYTFLNKFFAGPGLAFQNDTNGDVISEIIFFIGRRF